MCFYYSIVNMATFFASVTIMKGKIIRVKYEAMLSHPDQCLAQLSKFFGLKPLPLYRNESGAIDLIRPAHMLGGNRLISSKHIEMKKDEAWRDDLSFSSKWLIWLACLPTALILGYFP